jgi:hypothetical protein
MVNLHTSSWAVAALHPKAETTPGTSEEGGTTLGFHASPSVRTPSDELQREAVGKIAQLVVEIVSAVSEGVYFGPPLKVYTYTLSTVSIQRTHAPYTHHKLMLDHKLMFALYVPPHFLTHTSFYPLHFYTSTPPRRR